jgi:predicted membrane metal-binding protein
MPKLNTVLAIIFIVVFLVAVLFIFNNEKDWEQRQNSYIEKVNYSFEGKVISAKELGGSYFLEIIQVENIVIKRNSLSNHDDFAGVYCKDKKTIAFIAYFQYQGESYFNKKMPYIKVNTTTRNIIYFKDSNYSNIIQEQPLMPAYLYKNSLYNYEDNTSIRF